MAGFDDLVTASEFRDVIEQIAAGVVKRMRPDLIIGKVYSIDRAKQKAMVLLTGETLDDLISVRFANDKIPTTFMETTVSSLGLEAPGDIVRLAGGPGSYFILDFMFGTPVGIGGSSGGGTGGGRASQTFQFPNAATSWSMVHSFNTTAVRVTTYLTTGEEIEADPVVLDSSNVRVDFGRATAGYAIIEGD